MEKQQFTLSCLVAGPIKSHTPCHNLDSVHCNISIFQQSRFYTTVHDDTEWYFNILRPTTKLYDMPRIRCQIVTFTNDAYCETSESIAI